MPKGSRGSAVAKWREPVRSDRLSGPSASGSNRLFLGELLPSRARFRFTGHRQSIKCAAATQPQGCSRASVTRARLFQLSFRTPGLRSLSYPLARRGVISTLHAE